MANRNQNEKRNGSTHGNKDVTFVVTNIELSARALKVLEQPE
jgi:hypothetical protein